MRGAPGQGHRRENELSACADLVRVGNPTIGGEEFRPAISATEILLGEFPERIAGLHAHGFLRGQGSGRKSVCRFYKTNGFDGRNRLRGLSGNSWPNRTNRFDRSEGLHRVGGNCCRLGWMDKNSWRHRASKNFGMRGNIWTSERTNTGVKVGTRNFGAGIFRTGKFRTADIFTTTGRDSDGGERVALGNSRKFLRTEDR